MTFTEIEKFLHLIPEEITEEEKESLYFDVMRLQVTSDVEFEDIIKLFQVTQEILKFKGEQVESLILELDSLATKLGEEEAKHNQNYVNETEDSTSTQIKKNGKLSDTDDYNRKLVKMQIQADQLRTELEGKEQRLIYEQQEMEKLTNRISSLEEENKALRRELSTTQQELQSNASLKLITEDQDYPSVEKYHELTELLRQKNKHITQLLNDIEEIEKENNILKEKLSNVGDELAEGAEQMSKLSMERISLSTCVEELQGQVSKFEQENVGLRNQMAEFVTDKEERDEKFENIRTSFESKVQQWKEILQKKDTELTTLKLQLNSYSSYKNIDDTDHLAHISSLTKALAEREAKIDELQQQLEQATIDLNENTRLLEEQKELYKSRFDKNEESNLIKQLKKKIEQTENRIIVLDAKAKHAEEDSLRKAEEVTELIIQLREYESGTFGLEDAMIRIKELQKQRQVRDTQIEQLVQNLNQVQDEVNLLEQENHILRERLGISPVEQIIADDFSRMKRDKRNKLSEMREQLEQYEDDLVTIKLENRKLNKQITSLLVELNCHRLKESKSAESNENQISNFERNERLKTESSELIQSILEDDSSCDNTLIDERFKAIIDENESLRNGMHEILESINNRDISSMVHIESETLERLLEALDSRHVNGWYQPGMRLQAHIHHLNGVNKTLREELRIYRSREEDSLFELHEAIQKIEGLEKNTPLTYKTLSVPNLREHRSPKIEKSTNFSEETLKSNYEIEKELKNEKERCKCLESEIEKFREKFSILEEQVNKIQEQYDVDKENWTNMRDNMQLEIEVTKSEQKFLQSMVNDYTESLEIVKRDPEEVKKTFVENVFILSSLKVEHEQLCRKYEVLLNMESEVRQKRNKLMNEIYEIKQKKDREILELKTNNENLSTDLKNKSNLLNESVNRYEYEKLIVDFNELTTKHRELLHKEILVQSEKDKLILKSQNEIASLLTQKTELEIMLKQMLEENKYLKSSTSNISISDQLVTMAKQIASVELDLINKKQYSDHVNRMYELTKEQLKEAENRCKLLEDQLLLANQVNSEFQKNEANLKDQILRYPNETEFKEMNRKFKDAESSVALLCFEKRELKELANIAQDQIKALEQYNRYQDFEYDSLQRRILELQSLSDEKMIIDKLTKELLLLQQNSIVSNNKTDDFKEKVIKLEAAILQTKLKLIESENDYNRLKNDSNVKIRSMRLIIYELQKRYLGSLPLIKEELCYESLLRSKEECYMLTSLILDIKPSFLNIEENENEDENLKIKTWHGNKSKYNMQDFNMRLINEGLQNKMQIYAERLERQDKLIARLEQEIMHADEQCQEFLLYWSSHSSSQFLDENGHNSNNKFTQTAAKESKDEEDASTNVNVKHEQSDTLNQVQDGDTEKKLYNKLKIVENNLKTAQDKLSSAITELKEKELIISSKEKEIQNLQKIAYESNSSNDNIGERTEINENSIKKLALKATVESLQNIVNQKEETIKRLQNLLKSSREEHTQYMLQLQRELKSLQEILDSKEHFYSRMKTKLDNLEKIPSEKRQIIDAYLTKIHELEDELNQSNEKVEQLSNQLRTSTQQAELWSHTAEERLKTLQNMKHELDLKHSSNSITPVKIIENTKMSYNAMLQIIKEKSEEIERLNQTVEELKKRLGSGEKLPGYRDRLKNELERYKRKIELHEQKEIEDKAEIQRLKNQILTRSQIMSKKNVLMTPKEEQLMKKMSSLEEQILDYSAKEKKWKETKKMKCDEEVEKWQNRKRYQHTYEKMKQQLKEQSNQIDLLRINKERLKETVTRLEKERITLENKLKVVKIQNEGVSLIEELQKANNRLEDEVQLLRKSVELTTGTSSLTDVIENQERKIKSLQIAQKGTHALAEEVEKLNERKSQLQKYNVRLEEENMNLKLEIDRLKSNAKYFGEKTERDFKNMKTNSKLYIEEIDNQFKGNKRKNSDLERAILVLRRVVEKLQAENKNLHNTKVTQLQDKNYTEKLQVELQNLQENYLNSIEKASALDAELQNACKKIDSLQKLINRFQNGEEIITMKSQLAQKNQLLNKVKILLEKAAIREKELLEKVNDLQKVKPTTFS